MPLSWGDVSRPTDTASAACFTRDDAIGSTVNVRLAKAAFNTLSGSFLPERLASCSFIAALAPVGSDLMLATVSTTPSRKRLTVAGCAFRNDVDTRTLVVSHWPFGHSCFSSTSRRPPSWTTSWLRYGSGTHAPSMLPCLNVRRVWLFSCGLMLTSPPPWRSVFNPCDFKNDRKATSWVFPSCGVAMVLPFRSATLVMDGFTTRPAPPEAAPETIWTAPCDLVKALMEGLGPMKATS